MLSGINWRRVGAIAQREQMNRERFAPVVSSYRWWARRPHSVMGAVLDAATQIYGEDFAVADPFSGGGTVTFEAARRGLTAYAQDLYPWATEGLASALAPTNAQELRQAADAVLRELSGLRASYQTADGGELTHILRVRLGCCPACQEAVHLFPEHLVTRASRSLSERHAYFGCTACGNVTRARAGVKTFHCATCGFRHDTSRLTSRCPHCAHHYEMTQALTCPPQWKAVLVQHLVMEGALPRARLRPVVAGDPVDASVASTSFVELADSVPDGIETRRLARFGFTRWGDLYTERQAAILLGGLAAILKLPHRQAVKDRLAFAVIGCAEMPAYLSRWDRSALKPFEALANHRYAHSTLAVEMNPLSPVGRGTLPRRFAAACRALDWLSAQCGKLPPLKRVIATSRKLSRASGRVVVTTGSSTTQPIPDGTVQLTLSDPPYYDDVQYGELARLFHLWLAIYKPLAAIDESAEAVPNYARGIGVEAYQTTIASCLSESRRALARNGRLVLTFHNRELVAWQALAGALHQAGFDVLALAVVHAENGSDLCKRNVNSMLHDLVLECRPRSRRAPRPEVVVAAKSVAEKNLIAIGLALAQATRTGRPELLPALYESHLKRLKTTRRTIQ